MWKKIKKNVKVDYSSDDAISIDRQTAECVDPNCKKRVSKSDAVTTGGHCTSCYEGTMSDFGFSE